MPQSERPLYTIPARPAEFTLAMKNDGVKRLQKRAKALTIKDFARVMGVDAGQMSKILAGKSAPGPRVIAGAVAAFGWHALKDLFEVVPVDSNRGAA